MQAEIKRWGNSAAVRLPSKILAMAHMEVSSEVTIEVRDGKIVIESAAQAPQRFRLPFTEEFLLEGLDADTVHADELAVVSRREIGE
jgi:antitoxin MazE